MGLEKFYYWSYRYHQDMVPAVALRCRGVTAESTVAGILKRMQEDRVIEPGILFSDLVSGETDWDMWLHFDMAPCFEIYKHNHWDWNVVTPDEV